jgi:protein involved in polysaccharide export with SLBB domain
MGMRTQLTRLLLILAALAVFNGALQAAPRGYHIAPGDLLSITVFGEPDLTMDKVRVAANGTVSYPLLGEIQVAGYTSRELESRITALLRNGYLKKPQVTVSVLEYRPVYVNGAVNSPGGYSYREGMTVEKAITLAGGLKNDANPDKITVVGADATDDKPAPAGMGTPVQPGDVISVGEKVVKKQQFFIQGEVKSPGAYPYQDGLSIEKAIALAGGFTARASSSKINVVHESDPDQTVRENLRAPVQPGDVITIGAGLF